MKLPFQNDIGHKESWFKLLLFLQLNSVKSPWRTLLLALKVYWWIVSEKGQYIMGTVAT